MSATSLTNTDGQDGQFFAPDGRKFVYQNPMVRRGYASSSDRKKSPSPVANNSRSVIPRSFKPPKKGEKMVTEAVSETPVHKPPKQLQPNYKTTTNNYAKQSEPKGITSAIEYITNPVKLLGSMFRSDKKSDRNKVKRSPVSAPIKSSKPNPPKRELPKEEEKKVEDVDIGIIEPTILHSMGDVEIPKKKQRAVANVYKENDNWKMVNSRKPKPKVVQTRRPRSQSPIAMIKKERGTSVELVNQVELNAGMFMKKEKPNTASFRIQSAEGMARESKMLEKEKRKTSKHALTNSSRKKNPYTYAPKDVERPKHSWQRPKDLPKPKALKLTKDDLRPESRGISTIIAEMDPSLDKSNSNHCTASPIPGDFPAQLVEENVCFPTQKYDFPEPNMAVCIGDAPSQAKENTVVPAEIQQEKKLESEVVVMEDSLKNKENENVERRTRSRSRSRTRKKPPKKSKENFDKEVSYPSRRADNKEENVTGHNINKGLKGSEMEMIEPMTESYGLIDNLFKLFSPMVVKTELEDLPPPDKPASKIVRSKSREINKTKDTKKEKTDHLGNKKTDDTLKHLIGEQKMPESTKSSNMKSKKKELSKKEPSPTVQSTKEPSPSPFNPQRLFHQSSKSEPQKGNSETVKKDENVLTEATNYGGSSPKDRMKKEITKVDTVNSPSKDRMKTPINTKLNNDSNTQANEKIKSPSHTKLQTINKSPAHTEPITKETILNTPPKLKGNNENELSQSGSNAKTSATNLMNDKEVKSPNGEQLKNKNSKTRSPRTRSPKNKKEKDILNNQKDNDIMTLTKDMGTLLDIDHKSPFKATTPENKDSDNPKPLKSASVLKEIANSELDLFEVVKSLSPFKNNEEILKQEKELNIEIYKDLSPCIDTMNDSIDTLMETNKQLMTPIEDQPMKLAELDDFLPEVSLSHDSTVSSMQMPMPPPQITDDDHLIRIPLFGKQQSKVQTKRDTKAKANMLAPKTTEQGLGNKWLASHKPSLLDSSPKAMTKQQVLAFGSSVAIPKPVDSHVNPIPVNKHLPSVIGAAQHRFYFSKCSGNNTNSVIAAPPPESQEADQIQTFLLDTVSNPTFPPSVLNLKDSKNDSPLGVAIPMYNCQGSPINKALTLNKSVVSKPIESNAPVEVCNHMSVANIPIEAFHHQNASTTVNDYLANEVMSSISGLLPVMDKEPKKQKHTSKKANKSKSKSAVSANKKQHVQRKETPQDVKLSEDGNAQQKSTVLPEQQKSQAPKSSDQTAVTKVSAKPLGSRPPPRIRSPKVNLKRPTSPDGERNPSPGAQTSSLYEMLKNLCLAENSSERGELP